MSIELAHTETLLPEDLKNKYSELLNAELRLSRVGGEIYFPKILEEVK